VATSLAFACTKCGATEEVACAGGRVRAPYKCGADGCKSRAFRALPATMRTADWQKLRVQELLSVSGADSAKAGARTLEVELSADCVNCCTCGDVRAGS